MSTYVAPAMKISVVRAPLKQEPKIINSVKASIAKMTREVGVLKVCMMTMGTGNVMMVSQTIRLFVTLVKVPSGNI